MGIKIGKHITDHELIPGELKGTCAAVDALNTTCEKKNGLIKAYNKIIA